MRTDPVAVRLREIRDAQARVGSALDALNTAFNRDKCVHQQEIDALQQASNALTRLVTA